MEPTRHHVPRLDTMPDDILRLIITKVGAVSSTDHIYTILCCKDLNFNFSDPFVSKHLNLQPLVKKHLLANRYKTLMESCLAANNIDAHSIKGVLEYFHSQNHLLGMHHVRLAAKVDYKQGRYLYGAILMALGMIQKGKKVISKLTGEEGISVVESSWEDIQTSLSEINLSMKKVYVKSLKSMKPNINCHPLEINTACSKCFHFYVMSEFVEMMLSLNPTPGFEKEA